MSSRTHTMSNTCKLNLISYFENAKPQNIDHCTWTVNWQYAHREGRATTATGNQPPNYIAYHRTSDGEHRTRLAIKTNRAYYFLTTDRGKCITTEKCWGKEEPLMKDFLGAYQTQWGIPVTNTRSEDEAE